MPYIHVSVSDVIDELDSEDLIEELVRRGYSEPSKNIAAGLDGLDRIAHLAACGLVNDARTEALQMVGEAIGRPIH